MAAWESKIPPSLLQKAMRRGFRNLKERSSEPTALHVAGSLSYNIPNSSSKRVTQRDNLSVSPLEPSLGTFQTQTLGHGEVRGPCAFADFDELFTWALPRSDVCMTPLAGQSTPVPFFGPRPSLLEVSPF